MHKAAEVYPVVPGKDPKDVARILEDRPDERRESRRKLGVHLERAYAMPTPMGTFVIAYTETDKPVWETNLAMLQSDLQIDKDFLAKVSEVHGVDFSQGPPPGAEPPELLGDFVDPDVTERKRGLAFCVPVIPGAEDKGRAFAKEAFQARLAEHTASRRKLGVTREVVCLNHTPQGDVVGVYIEGDDPVEGNRRFAASRSEYDVWFKDQCKEIFPPDVDFNEPLPPVTEVFDSERAAVSR